MFSNTKPLYEKKKILSFYYCSLKINQFIEDIFYSQTLFSHTSNSV